MIDSNMSGHQSHQDIHGEQMKQRNAKPKVSPIHPPA
jgi:hypothetical protein